MTALQLAAMMGHSETCATLVADLGADLIAHQSQRSVLHEAAVGTAAQSHI